MYVLYCVTRTISLNKRQWQQQEQRGRWQQKRSRRQRFRNKSKNATEKGLQNGVNSRMSIEWMNTIGIWKGLWAVWWWTMIHAFCLYRILCWERCEWNMKNGWNWWQLKYTKFVNEFSTLHDIYSLAHRKLLGRVLELIVSAHNCSWNAEKKLVRQRLSTCE